MKILHVTECMAGGVATAVVGYGMNLGVHQHFLLANARRSHGGMKPVPEGVFEEVLSLPEDHLGAVQAVIKTAIEFQPDVIHAHSSFGGVYARVARLDPRVRKIPVVYTPHGLAFARQDVSLGKKLIFKGLEIVFAPLTSVFAGCSSNETALLREIAPKATHICVPNAVPQSRIDTFPKWEQPHEPAIGVLGRITAQRDPQMLIEIANGLRSDSELRNTKVVWIGDGPAELKDELQSAGIEITGWVDAAEVPRRLGSLSVLVHTARWDGFPMAVLEALPMGVPVIVSDIPALSESPRGARFSNSEEAIEEIRTLLKNPAANDWSQVLGFYNQENQRKTLETAYLEASGKIVA